MSWFKLVRHRLGLSTAGAAMLSEAGIRTFNERQVAAAAEYLRTLER